MAPAPVGLTVMVFDPNDRTQDYLSNDLFDDGSNFSLGATVAGKLAGRTSSVTLAGIYSTQGRIDLEQLLLPPGLETDDKDHSWYVGLQFAHFLYESPDRPGHGWGLFGMLGKGDGNPNPYEGFFTGGIGGKALFSSRPDDSFGLGYFYYSPSDALQSALNPLAEFDAEQGAELYYDYVVVHGVHLGFDLQYINPSLAANENGFVASLRLRFRL